MLNKWLYFLFVPLPVIASPDHYADKLAQEVFDAAQLTQVMSFSLFRDGVKAYMDQAIGANPNLVIIDYSRPSHQRRFYVINLRDKKLLHYTYTAHGVASGLTYAEHFSNRPESKQTSLGIYKTAETYQGKYGYSLRLDGLSKGLNDNARRRHIVIHGAEYASPAFLAQRQYIGWSWGCPALPPEKNRAIIDLIKGGSIVFAAYSNEERNQAINDEKREQRKGDAISVVQRAAERDHQSLR
ncbi:murein L,D-transpeptidase catalytic domain family protein [Photobacterium japonica]|uniref:murein L,D-transpeptidase catalytic domain family protein n=1 Tax=Photobacterium japonica TaxID=2910235 RepID=UPI003D0CE146